MSSELDDNSIPDEEPYYDFRAMLGRHVSDPLIEAFTDDLEGFPTTSFTDEGICCWNFPPEGIVFILDPTETIIGMIVHTVGTRDGEMESCGYPNPFGIGEITTREETREMLGPPTEAGRVSKGGNVVISDTWIYPKFSLTVEYSENEQAVFCLKMMTLGRTPGLR